MRFINPIPFVHDIRRSREFYENRLGLRVLEDAGNFVRFETGLAIHDGSALEQTVWGDALQPSEPYGRRNLLLYFEHDDMDAAFENIAPHAELIHAVERNGGSAYFGFTIRMGMLLKLANRRTLLRTIMLSAEGYQGEVRKGNRSSP
jgi:catechol 2,3-dioxygenase-like lactoylglutathione lyase family enzyme